MQLRIAIFTISFCLVSSLIGCGSASKTQRSAEVVSTGGASRGTHYDFADDEIGSTRVVAQAASMGSGEASQPQKRVSAEDRKQAATQVDRSERKLVKNAWLTVEVDDEDDYPRVMERVEKTVETLQGYVIKETSDSISFKVPVGRLDEAFASIDAIGEVVNRDVRVVDVTTQYVDLEIRIANLEKVRKRYQELVEQGQNVKEILEVEKELNRVTTQLEQLKGKMRVLSNQIMFATVHVEFEEEVLPGPIGWVFYGGYHAVKWLFVWD